MPVRSAKTRYNRAVAILSLFYMGLLFGAEVLFRHHALHGPIAYGVAVLPALPIIGIFAAIGRYLIEEQDEYVRMKMVRQTLVASGFMLGVATIWGFLESFDLVGHVDGYWTAVLWFLGLGIGGCVDVVLERGRGA